VENQNVSPSVVDGSDSCLQLSENQQHGLEMALAWFASKPDSSFVLRGYAGTGKSFLAAQICKALPTKTKISLCAPTHKAKHVLQTFADSNGLDVHVATLHSLLHAIPGEHDNDGKQSLESNRGKKDVHYRDFDLVIIDEASMIGKELLVWVQAQRTPTLFMGDPAQLPPVEDNEPESAVFSMPCGVELTQVMRYEGAIANLATKIRQQIDTQFLPRIETRGNVTKLSPDAWMDELVEHVELSLDNDDVHYVRAMAWTNKRVEALNKEMRDRIFSCPDAFFVGERLMAKDLIVQRSWDNESDRENVDILLYSCAECVVIGISRKPVELGKTRLAGLCLTLLREDGQEIVVLVLDHTIEGAWDEAEQYFADWRRMIGNLDYQDRGRQWTQYYQTMESINVCWKGKLMQRLQPALAITIHQAQGSTFKNAFVDLPNIYGCRESKLRNQLAYVAFTRASEKLFIGSKF
jgi:AAA domain/UvrD-like helicase C-terminal domain